MSTKKKGTKNHASGSNFSSTAVCWRISATMRPARKAPTMAARPMVSASSERPSMRMTPISNRTVADTRASAAEARATSRGPSHKIAGDVDHRLEGEQAQLQRVRLAEGHGADDAEGEQPEDVVEHRRAQDDAHRLALVQPQVLQHADRDADRRGHERDGDEEVLVAREAEGPADAESRGERQDRSQHGDLGGGDLDLVELAHVRLDPGHEEQHDHAELAERLEELALVHEVEDLRAEDRAGEELADDGRLPEAREEAPEQAGDGEGEEDLQEDVGHRELPGLRAG